MTDIRQALSRLDAGRATDEDISLLRRALQRGDITLSAGDRRVTIKGNVSNVATLAGDVIGDVSFVTLTASAYSALQDLAAPKPPQPAADSPAPRKGVPWPWLALDVLLAGVLALLGDTLAAQLQHQLSFPAVAALFTFVLALLVVVTLAKSGTL